MALESELKRGVDGRHAMFPPSLNILLFKFNGCENENFQKKSLLFYPQ
jgi:hypothetical protein